MSLTASSTDGVDVAIHDLGGGGPLLVFVHATGFHGRCYQRIATELADIRHCWAPDLRGHGDASLPAAGRFDWEGMADDLCAALDRLEIDEPIDMVGHSMGGAAILNTELRRPGTIRSAWLFEPIVFPPSPDRPPSTMADTARHRRPAFDTFEAAIERYSSRPPLQVFDPGVLDDYVRYGFRQEDDRVVLKCTPDSEASTFESTDMTLFPKVHAVTAPVTVVASTDGAPPSLVAPMVADTLPNADLVVWDDLTHFGPFTHPERAAAEIRAML